MNFELNFFQQEICFCTKEEVLQNLKNISQKEKVLLFASDSAVKRYALEPFIKIFLKNGGQRWSEIQPNPSMGLVTKMLSDLQEEKFTAIVALGGGSCIDLAKAYCAFANQTEKINEECLREEIKDKKYLEKTIIGRVPLYAIPTTAGTGSEATQWATIWDTTKNEKLSIDAPFLLPEAAWVCPELTYDMPPSLILATGLDALSHAMESCWVKASNPYSFALAQNAVETIANTLPKLLKNRQEKSLYNDMMQAALLAGLAFSQTRTGAAHAISYALTLQYDIPHGIAAAMSLPEILTVTKKVKPELAILEMPFKKYGGFKVWLAEICQPISPITLSGFLVPKSEVELLAKKALQTGRMQNNVYPFTQEKLQEVLLNIY